MTVHDPRADGRLARRLFSTGLMSDTKWRKLFQAIAEGCNPQPDHVVVKFIDVEGPKRMRFPFGLYPPRAYVDTVEFGPTELRAIEWLDVPGDIVALLQPIGQFPVERLELSDDIVILPGSIGRRPSFKRNGTYTRVTGYTNPR